MRNLSAPLDGEKNIMKNLRVDPISEETKINLEMIKKNWGQELILHNSNNYCAKIMILEKNEMVSLHFHAIKEETFILIKGKLNVITYVNGEKIITTLVDQFDTVTIANNVPHTFYSEEETVFIEASSLHQDSDSYRLNKSQRINKPLTTDPITIDSINSINKV